MEKTNIKVAPSILSANFSILGQEIKLLDKTSCEYIHIDIMDGHFVPNLTFGHDIVKSIRQHTQKVFDVHLMINPVKKFINKFVEAGADIITIHHEISEDVVYCLKLIKSFGKKAGISIKPSTDVSELAQYLDYVDLILIMTVEPGFGGQKFLDSQLIKIFETKKLIGQRKIEIEVDGGINNKNFESVIKAGANVLVAGSAIFKNSNYEANIKELKKPLK
tara:strand:- start:8224 stop:8883 length:660 start_codon:yes stop_codon:yes gene_type:complete